MLQSMKTINLILPNYSIPVCLSKCGEEGHMSRDCPTGGGGGSRACHKVIN